MKLFRIVPFVVLGAVVLSACSRTEPLPCPRVSVLDGAATVTKFREGSGRDLTDVDARGEIVDVATSCSYDGNVVTLDMQVAIAATRGPADEDRAAQFDYFVAVIDPDRNVLAKEIFDIRFAFPDTRTRVGRIEEIEPRIPLPDVKRAPAYGIIVGFQLTPEELQWNRGNGR